MTYILRIALVAAVMGLIFKGFDAIVNSVDLDSDQNTLFTSLVLLTFTSVMFWLVQEVNNVAGQLAGGISSAAVTLRGMAQGAMAPMRTAARMINPTSTRLDPRTGHQTTAGRLEHLAMGRSLWARNPAYRQAVAERLRTAWQTPDGGSMSKG